MKFVEIQFNATPAQAGVWPEFINALTRMPDARLRGHGGEGEK